MEKPKKVIEGYLKCGFLEITMKDMTNEMETVECMNRIWGLLSDEDVGLLAHRLLVPKFTELMYRVKEFFENTEILWLSVTIASRLLKYANKEEKRVLACRAGLRTLAEMVVKNHDKHKLVFCKENRALHLLLNIICALHRKLESSNDDNWTYPMLAGATRVFLPLISKFLLSFLAQYPKVDEYHRDVYATLVGEDVLLQYLLTSEQSGDILRLVKSDILRHLLDIYEKQVSLRGCDDHPCDCVTLSSIELCFQYIGDLKITKTEDKLPYVKTLGRALQIKKLTTRKECPTFYDNFQKKPIPFESYGENIMNFLCVPGSSEVLGGCESPYPEEYQRTLLESGAPEAMVDFILLCVDDATAMDNLYTSYSSLLISSRLDDLVDQLVSGYHVLLKHVERIDRLLGKSMYNIVYDSVVLSLDKSLQNCPSTSPQILKDLVIKSDLFDVLATYLTKKSPPIEHFISVSNILTRYKIVQIDPKLIAENTKSLLIALWTRSEWLHHNMLTDERLPFVMGALFDATNTYLPFVINTITDVKNIEITIADHLKASMGVPIIVLISHILPIIWTFIKRDPPGPLVEALAASARRSGYTFLPYATSETSKKNKKKNRTNPIKNKAKLYKYLNENLIQFLDNPILGKDALGDVKNLVDLSANLVTIVKSHTTDEELYALEDLASPVMWLASKTDNDVVINNVKMFIHILHSE